MQDEGSKAVDLGSEAFELLKRELQRGFDYPRPRVKRWGEAGCGQMGGRVAVFRDDFLRILGRHAVDAKMDALAPGLGSKLIEDGSAERVRPSRWRRRRLLDGRGRTVLSRRMNCSSGQCSRKQRAPISSRGAGGAERSYGCES